MQGKALEATNSSPALCPSGEGKDLATSEAKKGKVSKELLAQPRPTPGRATLRNAVKMLRKKSSLASPPAQCTPNLSGLKEPVVHSNFLYTQKGEPKRGTDRLQMVPTFEGFPEGEPNSPSGTSKDKGHPSPWSGFSCSWLTGLSLG